MTTSNNNKIKSPTKRKFTRVDFISKCTISKDNVCFIAEIQNISASGFYVNCNYCEVEYGEIITICLHIYNNGIENIAEYRSRVVRLTEEGFGLLILESDFFNYTKLIDIISKNSEDGKIIKKEIANSSEFVRIWKGRTVNIK